MKLRILLRNLAPLLLVGLFLAGLVLLGNWARHAVAPLDRYQLPFAHIDCTPPPGQAKDEFLAEVQYLAGWPDRLDVLEDALAARLADAFARHPWVEKVERVETIAAGVQVRLAYRTPVLAVRLPGKSELRAVDRHGILLPASAVTAGLPIFPGPARAPTGPAGTPWDDPRVQTAARQASAGKQDARSP